MTDPFEIPAFLRRTGEERVRSAYVPRAQRRDTWARPRPPRGWPKGMPVPKTVTPEAIALAQEIDRREKEKAKARFAALKARRA